MRRLKGDRGAVAVVVALLMIPILVCAALVIDVGALYLRRSELQNAADAGALAIAQDCAGGTCTINSLAIAQQNVLSDSGISATAAFGPLDRVPGSPPNSVTVTTASAVDFMFAPVMDLLAPGMVPDPRYHRVTVPASATAAWGQPVGGTAILPIAFPTCTFDKLPAAGGVIPFTKSTDRSCYSRTGHDVPGGFGWLTPDIGSCLTVSKIPGPVDVDTGNNDPGANCVAAQLNQTVLLPVYDRFEGSGTGGHYFVYAYAAFHITGYYFSRKISSPQDNPPCNKGNCISGSFVKFVAISDAFTYDTSAPYLGARVVRLIK